MAAAQHYSNAPITEAIIDLQVRLPQGTPLSALERVGEAQRDQYPTRRARNLARGHFQFGQQVAAEARSEPIGYLFVSADERQVFQARTNGFTMSRLAPYESWEPFKNEARRLWTSYQDMLKPEVILRMAVRYINRLDLPGPTVEIKDYLRTGPEISPDLADPLAGFLMQVVIPQDDIKCTLLLNETIIEPAISNCVSIVLDIDLSRVDDIPTKQDDLWNFFEEMHDRKNAVFEACISDKTRELIR